MHIMQVPQSFNFLQMYNDSLYGTLCCDTTTRRRNLKTQVSTRFENLQIICTEAYYAISLKLEFLANVQRQPLRNTVLWHNSRRQNFKNRKVYKNENFAKHMHRGIFCRLPKVSEGYWCTTPAFILKILDKMR